MLSPKQIGTICFAIFSFVFSAPLFATDIPSFVSTADCKNNPLQTYSGTSNLQADWQANTIQLHWYNGDDELTVPSASQSCVYDGTLTPPATIPTKTGYTFKGWRVKQAVCEIPSTLADTDAESYGYICDGSNNVPTSNASIFGLSENGTWAASWSNGDIVYGRAKCSETIGNVNKTGVPSDTVGDGCWCLVTEYKPTGSNQCNINSSSWVYRSAYSGDPDACLHNCAFGCAFRMKSGGAIFRPALFGVGQ